MLALLTRARHTTHGTRAKVFRCRPHERGFDKGWGLRCLDRIPAGSFVACYLGEVLTDRSVDDRGKQTHDDYVFGLDFAACASQNTGHGAGAGDWGLASPFTPSPRTNVGAAAAAPAAAPASRNLCGRSPGRLAGVGGGGRERPSLSSSPSAPPSTPRNGGAPPRKKAKRSARSPLAAAEAAAAIGAGAGAGVAGGGSAAGPLEEEVLDVHDSSIVVSPEKKTLEAFMGVTGLDRKRAAFFVTGADGNLDRAMNHYFEKPTAADGADRAGGSAAAAVVVGVGDDADDEREESDDNENDNVPAAAAASAEGGSGSNPADNVSAEESMPDGLSEQERLRWIHDHNERERLLFRREEEEAVARLRQHQKPPHLPPVAAANVLPPPLSGGGGSRDGDNAAAASSSRALGGPRAVEMEMDGGSGTAFSRVTHPGSAPERTVSPPSSPAEVLCDDAFDGKSGGGAAGMARLTDALSSASLAPAGAALISGLRAGSPPRGFGVRGGDGVDAAAVVVADQPASTNVLPLLASPLKLGPGGSFFRGWGGSVPCLLFATVFCRLGLAWVCFRDFFSFGLLVCVPQAAFNIVHKSSSGRSFRVVCCKLHHDSN